MSDNEKYTMNISLNVLNHLGINLYSNIPAVLSEVVANAWDADAEEVEINIDIKNEKIIIIDNGFGMTLDDINNKFLNIGYSKRKNGCEKTPKHDRDVMGRKGIGKLSMFSIAKNIQITTKSKGTLELNSFILNTDKIEESIKDGSDNYHPEDTKAIDFGKEYGTKIELTQLKKNISSVTTDYLRKRVARRFSIIGPEHSFIVKIDGEEVSVTDRDYFHKVQYLWHFKDKVYEDYCSNVEEVREFDNIIKVSELDENNKEVENQYTISGWLGLVGQSGALQDGDENINKIVVMVRDKLAQEDILEEFREGGMYTKYLFGEIHADFLDLNDHDDIATSSRQKIIEDDPRYLALKEFISTKLKHIARKRAEYKEKSGLDNAMQYESVENWFNALKGDTKKKAKQLFGKINQIATDEQHQKQLFKHGILAFESLRTREALDSLEKIDINHLEDFMGIFLEFDDIEKTLFHEITSGRIKIIDKLKKEVNGDVLEKVLQEYLYEHLWLLDPSWDRISENTFLEQNVSKAFNEASAKLSVEEASGRVDIRYVKTSGTHIIVELKKATVNTDSDLLRKQVKKYIRGLRKQLELVGRENEPIQAVCVLGKKPTDWNDMDEHEIEQSINASRLEGISFVTYQQLIHDSYEAYKLFLEASSQQGRILKLIRDIEVELN